MTDTASTTDTTKNAERTPDDVAATRRCGRCRLRFPIPDDTHPMELRDWWVCPNCSETLLPGRQRTPTTHLEQHGGPT
jgi:hypothetical protein